MADSGTGAASTPSHAARDAESSAAGREFPSPRSGNMGKGSASRPRGWGGGTALPLLIPPFAASRHDLGSKEQVQNDVLQKNRSGSASGFIPFLNPFPVSALRSPAVPALHAVLLLASPPKILNEQQTGAESPPAAGSRAQQKREIHVHSSSAASPSTPPSLLPTTGIGRAPCHPKTRGAEPGHGDSTAFMGETGK